MRIFLILSFLLASFSIAFSQQSQTGEATYYSDKYQGRKTASGELYDRSKYTAAHRTLPFGALVQVTNIKSGQSVVVKINDMGPSKESRIIDLSYAAAEAIGVVRAGVAQVRLDVLEEYPKANSSYAGRTRYRHQTQSCYYHYHHSGIKYTAHQHYPNGGKHHQHCSSKHCIAQ